MNNMVIELNGKNLEIGDVIAIGENYTEVKLSDEAVKKISDGRTKLVKQLTDDDTKHIAIYGTNRGCGNLKGGVIPQEQLDEYQIKYIKAHNCGTGGALPENIVRAIMVIRLNSFAKGMSGMQLETCQLMVDMLNKRVTPWILEEGSVGASGDLVPLAMLGAVLISLKGAKFYYEDELYEIEDENDVDAAAKTVNPKDTTLYKVTGLFPVKLGAKEAMGLTNGSNFIAATAIIASRKIRNIIKCASVSTALSLEAIRGEKKAFDELINEKSNRHDGQLVIAKDIRALIKNSNRTTNEAQKHLNFSENNLYSETILKKIFDIGSEQDMDVPSKIEEIRKLYADEELGFNIKVVKSQDRVQDRYSFRCAPHIHGATVEALDKLEQVLEQEINSASDNPLFDFDNPTTAKTKDDREIDSLNFASGGNFHGQALAAPIDYMKLSLTSLSLNVDKRTFSLLDENLSYGLPQDLAVGAGNSGYMIAQYAGAARAAENRILSTPASIMSVATAANQEDFVSMGSIGVLHLLKVIYNTEILVAIELLCATRAVQLTESNLGNGMRELGEGTQKVYDLIKTALPPYTEDNYIRTEIETVKDLVTGGNIVRYAEIWEGERKQ